MSKEDIEKAVREAEKFAEEDKKAKEAVEAKNTAEQMIYQTEKTLADLGDKVTDSEKAPINEAMEKLRNTVKDGTTEQIKADTEALQKAFYPIAEKLYAQQQGGAEGQPQDGNVYGTDADFEDKT